VMVYCPGFLVWDACDHIGIFVYGKFGLKSRSYCEPWIVGLIRK